MSTDALHFLILTVSGWLNQRQQRAKDYLKDENRVLRDRLGGKRKRFTDKERRRLAIKAKVVGRKALMDISCIVTPDPLLRWYRQLVAQKYRQQQTTRTWKAPDKRGYPRFSHQDGPRNSDLGIYSHQRRSSKFRLQSRANHNKKNSRQKRNRARSREEQPHAVENVSQGTVGRHSGCLESCLKS